LPIVEKHAPLLSRTIVERPTYPWYNDELHNEIHLKWKFEKKWCQSKLTIVHEIYRNQCTKVNKMLTQARVGFYKDKIEECGKDQKNMFKITKQLLGNTDEVVMPKCSSSKDLA